MAGSERRQLNRRQIKAHLKAAVLDLTPNVLDKIDLSTPQTAAEDGEESGLKRSPAALMRRRIRVIGTLAAACFCMIAVAGGTYTYRNGKVDSVIEIDVNPSVELSVNRKNRVLSAVPLNEDAAEIMAEMDLKGVNLNVAVNAVIGAMVTHGYLDDLDNAILVTVSNDSVSKAASLRSAVVTDIQTSLEENQVEAVVYDQQAVVEEDVKQLADEYGISYGKAYFLKELISQNPSLTMEDMEKLAPLTMEEIAGEIADGSYAVGGRTGKTEETTEEVTTTHRTTEAVTTPADTTQEESETTTEGTTAPQTAPETTQPPQTETPAPTVTEATTEASEPVTEGKVKIDYVDYYNGIVTVNFKTKVKWKNPTVSVKDADGNSFSAMVGDTDSSLCEIHVSGLTGGTTYTFVLGGVSPKNGRPTTVKGSFDTPVIGDGEADEEPTEPPDTEDSETEPSETETLPNTESESSTENVTKPSEPETVQSSAETASAPETERKTEAPETTKEAASAEAESEASASE